MIAIIDYGMGNIHSVNKALQLNDAETIVTNKAKDIQACEKVVLPGVGAFDDAMIELEKQELAPVLRKHIKNKKPFLGICLGMQLLFRESQEATQVKGLGVLKGRVKRFPAIAKLKVPHMGWNTLLSLEAGVGSSGQGKCPLLKDIPENAYVYFCHSYYPEPEDKSVTAAVTNHGIDFASVVWQDNVYGVQFHPEKSQAIGLKMLENFVKL